MTSNTTSPGSAPTGICVPTVADGRSMGNTLFRSCSVTYAWPVGETAMPKGRPAGVAIGAASTPRGCADDEVPDLGPVLLPQAKRVASEARARVEAVARVVGMMTGRVGGSRRCLSKL